ncbi:MAG: RdgB/HAM1 family non-canonical purine NTP pyrophosphatase [Chryseolinea sp.]
MRICFATNNQHKLEEVRNAVVNTDIQILSLSDIKCVDELPETQETLEGNSLQKASYLYETYKLPCFADDTGLEVEVLNGAPGVFSARYAGAQRDSDDNIALLLKNMEGKSNRTARFRTVITLLGFAAEPVYFEGVIAGTISQEKSGEHGFGYDPVFIPLSHSKSFAQMSMAEKNQLSHRALAVAQLVRYLNTLA